MFTVVVNGDEGTGGEPRVMHLRVWGVDSANHADLGVLTD